MPDKVVVFHGTNCEFSQIDLTKSKNNRDFGMGFYTTTIASQAEAWAKNMQMRRGEGKALVYEFELTLDASLSVETFEGLTIEWLDFVKPNRTTGGLPHSFDLVIGPVANDNTLLTVSRYMQGIYTADEALRRLAYFKANDQISLHTEKALEFLKPTRRYSID